MLHDASANATGEGCSGAALATAGSVTATLNTGDVALVWRQTLAQEAGMCVCCPVLIQTLGPAWLVGWLHEILC